MAAQTEMMLMARGPSGLYSRSPLKRMEQERIPIVGHIITDEDVGALQVRLCKVFKYISFTMFIYAVQGIFVSLIFFIF